MSPLPSSLDTGGVGTGGGGGGGGNPPAWSGATTYGVGVVVVGSDVNPYISIAPSNINNDPTLDTTFTNWSPFPNALHGFTDMGGALAVAPSVWNSGLPYTLGTAVSGSDHNLYFSIVNGANLNHNPVGDAGVHWFLVNAASTAIYFNVKTYGATGNGVTNDHNAIQSAITAAAVAGGVVFFPAGNYVCSTGFLLGSGSYPIEFLGVGYQSILTFNLINGTLFDGGVAYQVSNLALGAGSSGQTACKFAGATNGTNALINCTVTGAWTTATVGVSNGTEYVIVSDNQFFDCTAGGYGANTALISTGNGAASHSWTICNNTFDGCTGDLIALGGSAGTSTQHHAYDNRACNGGSPTNGIVITANSDYNIVHDNDMHIASTPLLNNSSGTHNQVQGCIVRTAQSTTYQFVLADVGTVVASTDGSAVTFTIDANSGTPYPLGAVIEVFQSGAGQVTIAGAGGVTLRSNGSKVKTAAQYATIGLRQDAIDTWVLSGDLV